MMVWRHIAAALETDAICALVTVAYAGGSTPREVGARMIVRADGGFHGTIGGGTLEWQALDWARGALAEGKPGLFNRTVSLGPDLGQCCGGRVDVAVEVITGQQLDQARKFAALEAQCRPIATVAEVLSGRALTRSLVVGEVTSMAPFDLKGTVLAERFGSWYQPVWLFGAGHVGKALMLALAPLPFQVTWVDTRKYIFPPAVPANVTKVVTEQPEVLLQEAPGGAMVVVMTHSHALDEDIAASGLAQQRFSYVGVIGSKTKAVRFRSRLKKRGLAAGLIDGLTCPIGAGGIKSKLPAVIAAGVVVELLRVSETRQAVDEQDFALAEGIALGQ